LVSDKPRPQDSPGHSPERTLAIALENVTPQTAAGTPAGAAAPRVVASGRGAVAEQILQIAFERGVKVRTDSDLAEILAAVDVDSEIPLAALAGVAEILRYLYSTDAAGGSGAAPQTEGARQAGSARGPQEDKE
jgi:flagellar biosynthesis protein